MTKCVLVTEGVVSSLGKGVASASRSAQLESRGLKVALIKLDRYLNVDPGFAAGRVRARIGEALGVSDAAVFGFADKA